MDKSGLLVLADGTTFEGYAVGYQPETGATAGEVVFNTALSGYQEIVTDPSYAGRSSPSPTRTSATTASTPTTTKPARRTVAA